MKLGTTLCVVMVIMTTKCHLVSTGMPPGGFLLPHIGSGEYDLSGDSSHHGGEESKSMGGEGAEGYPAIDGEGGFNLSNSNTTSIQMPLVDPTIPPATDTPLTLPNKYNDTDAENGVTLDDNLAHFAGGSPENGEDDGLARSTGIIDDDSSDVKGPDSYSSSGADITLSNMRYYIALVSASVFCLVF